MFDIHFSPAREAALGMYIDGGWQTGIGDRIAVENPANEHVIASIAAGTSEQAEYALRVASKAFLTWKTKPAIERAHYVLALAERIDKDAESLARIIVLEQGKPITQARGEVAAAVSFLRYSAEGARRIEGDIVSSDNAHEEIQIRRHPYGVVVGLTAWNYPAALAARKLGPALVAGNTFVLLAHELTPLSGLALAQFADDVGIPAGVFNVVTGRGPEIGQALVENPQSSLITMTGSNRAGIEIYKSGSSDLKVLRLELGGKAPFIVMDDADVDAAVAAAVTARYTNCGQICTCNERMYLHQSIKAEFLEKFVAASRALTLGDPMTEVDLGPKVSGVELDKTSALVRRGLDEGAQLLLRGGELSEGEFEKGHWYSPTVLEVYDNSSVLMQEEIFAPVAVAMGVESFDEALALANDSRFGLSAYLFTQDLKHIARAPYELNFGELYLNRSNGEAIQGYHSGWGHSGLGGEDGKYGFDNYLRKQTSYFNWG